MRPPLLALMAPVVIVGIGTSLFLSSCYVAAQGARYLALRYRAVPVAKVLADPRTPPTLRALLERVGRIRDFAVREIGLRPTKSYGSIVELESDRLATVVSACAELSFDRFLWSYPLVGKLPYRGYFDPKEAEGESARLKKLGLDVVVRPVDAFSTLGWLSDPLFSFMASYAEADIAELVIHEMTHATIFAKGAEQFNEELATFVGRQGALLWLASVHGADSPEVANALRDRADTEAFASWLRGTATELASIYGSGIPNAAKRARKAEVIAARAAVFKIEYSKIFATDRYAGFPMDGLNNAYLDLYRLYEGEPSLYRDYYEKACYNDLRRFMVEAARLVKQARGGDPKEAMRREIANAK